MKAILLAAGVGKRMGPHALPKCLLALQGRSLLSLTFDLLRSCGVREAVLVVGYEKEQVIREAQRRAGHLKVKFVENPRFREGAILSLWAAREEFGEDVLVMDADVLCPPSGFERLIRSVHGNCLLVDGSSSDTGEEQMVFGKEDRALTITKRPDRRLRSQMTFLGESVGFLKLTRQGASLLRRLVEEKVQQGSVGIEHEEIYPELFEKVRVGYERIDGLAWTEIDTPEDWNRAEREILPRWENLRCLNRWIASWFLPWILRLPLHPNQWTFLSLLAGLASLGCIAQGTLPMRFWGAFFFQLFYLIDNWDGEVARFKGLSSRWGGWFDIWTDAVIQVGLPFALAKGLVRSGAPEGVWILAFLAAAGLMVSFLVTGWAKKRGFGPAVYGDPAREKGISFLHANLTHENFSLLVALVLLGDFRVPFLIALALGTQVYWICFVFGERKRLFL